MSIRIATIKDVKAISDIYEEIHDLEEKKLTHTGWKRNVYPTEKTAISAIEKGEMYVIELDNKIVAAAKINHMQEKEYSFINWKYDASPEKVLVIHTLVVSPKNSKKGIGTAFVNFYEETAKKLNCTVLRLDTNEKNLKARELYKKLGYSEAGVIPTVFNGIDGVSLVLLEKAL